MLVLERQKGLIIIDEIQRKEELFPIIRVLVDKKDTQRRFLILGSASRELIRPKYYQAELPILNYLHFVFKIRKIFKKYGCMVDTLEFFFKRILIAAGNGLKTTFLILLSAIFLHWE